MKKSTIIIIGASVVVAGTATWIILNRIRKQKLYDKLMLELEKDPNVEASTLSDYDQPGMPFNTETYKNSSSSLLSDGNAAQIVKDLKYNINGGIFSIPVASEVIHIFTGGFSNKTQVSQISDLFQKKYNESLISDLMLLDGNLPFGFTVSATPVIKGIIDALPD